MMEDDGVGPFLEMFATFSKRKNVRVTRSTFEEASRKTGFGKFNFLLILLSTCGIWSTVFETSTMSFIMVPAKDAQQNSQDEFSYSKTMFYTGMICSVLTCGLLTDILGRKKMMMVGYFLSSSFVFISICLKTKGLVIACKLLGEVTMTGLQGAMASYLSEFHCSKYRPIILLAYGFFLNDGRILFPLFTMQISSSVWVKPLLFGVIELNWWNLYSIICGLFGIITGIVLICLPESPKYFMTIGKNTEAITVFRMVYRMNTGKSSKSFPVCGLVEETEKNVAYDSGSRLIFRTIKKIGDQLKPLVSKRYFGKLLLICFIQLLISQSFNMIRMWIPQIIQATEDYTTNNNVTTRNVCSILDIFDLKHKYHNHSAAVDSSLVKNNYIGILFANMAFYLLTGTVLHIFGKKKMLVILTTLAGTCCCMFYIFPEMTVVSVFVSLLVASENVANTLILATMIEIFPTSIRTIVICISMSLVKMGSRSSFKNLSSSISFIGCVSHFFIVGGLTSGAGMLGLLLPNTENTALK